MFSISLFFLLTRCELAPPPEIPPAVFLISRQSLPGPVAHFSLFLFSERKDTRAYFSSPLSPVNISRPSIASLDLNFRLSPSLSQTTKINSHTSLASSPFLFFFHPFLLLFLLLLCYPTTLTKKTPPILSRPHAGLHGGRAGGEEEGEWEGEGKILI